MERWHRHLGVFGFLRAGSGVKILRCLGARDFVVPHRSEKDGATQLHPIAIFYEAECADVEPVDAKAVPGGNDSAGAVWVDVGALNPDNTSPLVMQALVWLRGEADWGVEAGRLDEWNARQ